MISFVIYEYKMSRVKPLALPTGRPCHCAHSLAIGSTLVLT